MNNPRVPFPTPTQPSGSNSGFRPNAPGATNQRSGTTAVQHYYSGPSHVFIFQNPGHYNINYSARQRFNSGYGQEASRTEIMMAPPPSYERSMAMGSFGGAVPRSADGVNGIGFDACGRELNFRT